MLPHWITASLLYNDIPSSPNTGDKLCCVPFRHNNVMTQQASGNWSNSKLSCIFLSWEYKCAGVIPNTIQNSHYGHQATCCILSIALHVCRKASRTPCISQNHRISQETHKDHQPQTPQKANQKSDHMAESTVKLLFSTLLPHACITFHYGPQHAPPPYWQCSWGSFVLLTFLSPGLMGLKFHIG